MPDRWLEPRDSAPPSHWAQRSAKPMLSGDARPHAGRAPYPSLFEGIVVAGVVVGGRPVPLGVEDVAGGHVGRGDVVGPAGVVVGVMFCATL